MSRSTPIDLLALLEERYGYRPAPTPSTVADEPDRDDFVDPDEADHAADVYFDRG